MEQTEEHDRLMRYLLGTLPESEQAAIETEYFGDREKFEEVWAAEDDLFDSYLSGALRESDRLLFEQRFLSSRRGMERLRSSAVFRRSISAATRDRVLAPSEKTTWLQAMIRGWSAPKRSLTLAFAVLTFALVIAAFWGLYETARLRRELLQRQTEQLSDEQRLRQMENQAASNGERIAALTEELKRSREQFAALEAKKNAPPGVAPEIAFLLTAGLARSEGRTPTLRIPQGTESVALRVALGDGEYPKYIATLRTAEGAEVWRQSALKKTGDPTRALVTLHVPAVRLPRNDYILKLSAINTAGESEDIGQYYFRVER